MDFWNWKWLVEADGLRELLAIPFSMLMIVALYQIQKKIRGGTREEGISYILLIIVSVLVGRWINQCFA
jgi:hypothetical protein